MTRYADSSPSSQTGRRAGKEKAITLYELSLEYEQTAADLRRRIVELERAGKEAADENRRHQLEGRVRPLRSMYRDVRAVARHLEHYYEKHTPRRPGARTAGERRRRA